MKAAAELVVEPSAAPAVKFQNVSFSYGEKQTLKNVSFTVPAGTATAIVGLTGSGKTTMLNLLERFYETGEGSVTLDGQDVKAMSLGQLRAHYAYVQQDAGVFSGTIREVLTYGISRAVSDDEIILGEDGEPLFIDESELDPALTEELYALLNAASNGDKDTYLNPPGVYSRRSR